MTDMSTSGDDARWTLLERQTAEGLPLVVRSRVRDAEILEFEQSNEVSAIIVDLRPEIVRDDGLPRNLDELHRLEDDIVEKLDALPERCIHTASVTGDARRTMYIAHDASAPLQLLVDTFALDFGELQLFRDFELDVYQEFITPTALDKQLEGDQGVIAALESHGDVAEAPRKIDFWFYGERAALDRTLVDLGRLGLELDHWLDDPVGFVATSESPATMVHFRQLTPRLVELADKHGISYDGWETFIVKSDEAVLPEVDEAEAKPKSFMQKLFGQKKN